MKKLVLIILGLLTTTSAIAECGGVSCVDERITRIYVNADGDTLISTSGDETKLSCTPSSNKYITLEKSSTNYDATYSLLLMAHTTEHPIWVRTNSSGDCKLVYAVSDK